MRDSRYWCDESSRRRSRGDLDGAVSAARSAIDAGGGDAEAHALLAHALRLSGDVDAAADAATIATQCDPEHAPGWFNLGATLVARNRLSDAVAAYRRAVTIAPRYAEAWSNLGGALGAAGDADGELDAYRHAVDANPRLPQLWSNLGDALRIRGEHAAAEDALRKAISLDPGYASAWINLGVLLNDTARHDEAIEACQRALDIDGSSAEAWSNFGIACTGLGRHDDALAAHRRAESLKPHDAAVLFNLGVALKASGDARSAVAVYRRALALPHAGALGAGRVADLHWNLSLALLTLESFDEGWREYAWRWRRSRADVPRHELRMDDARPPAGSSLLVWGEQGVGDEILYASMIPDAVAAGIDVTFECDARLVGLFGRSLRNAKVRARGTTTPAYAFDATVPVADLGRWFRRTVEDFPRHTGYLLADEGRRNECRSMLRASSAVATAPVVGISWRSSNAEFGGFKSNDPHLWGPLLGPDVTWVNLQYGDTHADLAAFRSAGGATPVEVAGIDRYNDIEGLAALVAACDLVITVSNVTAHVAGALGRPVWLLLPRARGKIWYWFENRETSPWYPSMRVFRQERDGDWAGVIGRVRGALAQWRSARG